MRVCLCNLTDAPRRHLVPEATKRQWESERACAEGCARPALGSWPSEGEDESTRTKSATRPRSTRWQRHAAHSASHPMDAQPLTQPCMLRAPELRATTITICASKGNACFMRRRRNWLRSSGKNESAWTGASFMRASCRMFRALGDPGRKSSSTMRPRPSRTLARQLSLLVLACHNQLRGSNRAKPGPASGRRRACHRFCPRPHVLTRPETAAASMPGLSQSTPSRMVECSPLRTQE